MRRDDRPGILRFTLATSVVLPAAAFVGATTVLALLKLAMVDAGAFGIAELRSGMPAGKAQLMFAFFLYANFTFFLVQLLACCLLAWWTIRLARMIADEVPLEHPAEWYGNVWCLPIANLWRPFEGLRELWLRTGRYTRLARWLLGSAWVAWVAYQLLCVLGLCFPSQPREPAGQCWLLGLWTLRDSVFVVGSVLGILIVVWLTAIQPWLVQPRDAQ